MDGQNEANPTVSSFARNLLEKTTPAPVSVIWSDCVWKVATQREGPGRPSNAHKCPLLGNRCYLCLFPWGLI